MTRLSLENSADMFPSPEQQHDAEYAMAFGEEAGMTLSLEQDHAANDLSPPPVVYSSIMHRGAQDEALSTMHRRADGFQILLSAKEEGRAASTEEIRGRWARVTFDFIKPPPPPPPTAEDGLGISLAAEAAGTKKRRAATTKEATETATFQVTHNEILVDKVGAKRRKRRGAMKLEALMKQPGDGLLS